MPATNATAPSLADLARKRGARIYGTHVVPTGQRLTLEDLMTLPCFFGLEKATPTQRAIYRVSDGLSIDELWQNAEVREAFGEAKPPQVAPDTFAFFSAIRGAKSAAAAMRCIQATQECDLSRTGGSDIVSVPCLSTTKERAADVFQHLSHMVRTKPALRPLLVGNIRAESLSLRHPSGRPIEIRVTAIAQHGSTLVGRWLAGCIFDEATRMVGQTDGVRNLEQSMAAIAGRMLPGSAVWFVGSPHAPFGPAYEIDRKYFGAPADGIVVVRAKGTSLYPDYWTAELLAKLKRDNPDAYQTDFLARFLDAAGAMFSVSAVEKATRPSVEYDSLGAGVQSASGWTMTDAAFNPLQTYTAGIDPASRGNTFALAIATNNGTREQVILTRRWRPAPGAPLDLDDVWRQVAETCAPYGIKHVRSDPWGADPLRPVAKKYGMGIADESWTTTEKTEFYERLRIRLERDLVELPSDMTLSSDLMRCRKVPTYTGFRIDSPVAADGSHGDTASAVVQALAYDIPPPRVAMPEKGSEEFFALQMAKHKTEAMAKAQRETQRKWKRGGFRAVMRNG